ncbi:T9SS type A sorting domain-containing protein [Ekhidna sp.]|uniref:T9SS type A sorting domain-containing protein n=1 Tax=Ekhidna sp. TaxID=2608089 RepID=UPI003CCC0E58
MRKFLPLVIAIFFGNDIFAQSPGGVTADLQLWYKANTGAEEANADPAEDGDPVEFWRDQSGNGYDAEQGTSSFRPILDLTNTINGNPVFVFDGNDDYFPINSLNYPAVTTPSAISVFAVLTTTNSGEGVILSFDRNEYFRFAGDHNNDGGFGLSTTNSSGTVDDFNANGTPEDDGIPHILGGSFDSGVSGVNKFLYFDGTLDNSTDAGNTAFGTGTTRFGFIGVGSEANTFNGSIGPTNYLDGNLAELIYYSDAPTATERQQIETYLAIKYGITLSSDTDGDATAFEAGEGDYLAADGITVVWDADANSAYHNDIAALAEDADAGLSQSSSKSINSSAILRVTDNSLSENDYLVWGHNNAGFASSASASSFDRQLDQVWKLQITGATNNVDQLEFDLNAVSVLPSSSSDIALLIDDNASFSSPIEVSGTFSSNVLTLSNVDFSSFAGDIYMTVAFTLPVPAGVSNNLTFWFKGDAGTEEAASDATEDGDLVRFWRDQSGNGYDGEQNDSGERPTYDASNTINNNPVISFNGSTHLPIVDLNYDLTTNTLDEFTIYSIVKSSQNDEGIIVSFDRSSFFRFALNHNGSANYGLSTNVEGAPDETDDNNASNSASDGVTHLIGANYSTTSDEKNLFFNGSVGDTYSGAHGATGGLLGDSGEVPRFGYIAANSEASTFNGNDNGGGIDGGIAEIIYFESILSATERSQIESYLAVKYGITLSSNYVASNGSTIIWDNTTNAGYNNMIAAIGRDVAGSLNQSQSLSESPNAILTVLDASLNDGDYFFWGNDGAGLGTVTSGSGSRDARFERIWRYQVTGATTNIDQLDFDLSSVIIKPDAIGNYRLLLDDNASFSSPTEFSASSFANDILTFTNIDFSGEVFFGIAYDPDLDNDGISDANDLDDDNDGLLDTDEGSGLIDTDSDGIADSRDLDSDNDGIGDLYESGAEADADVTSIAATLDINDDGMIDLSVSVGANGYADILETAVDNGTRSFTISDSDSAGPVDFRDLDSDNNGISDLVESGRSTNIDTDDDGIFEGTDADQDGVPDEVDSNNATFGSILSANDQDSDGTPDFRDLDNDGDTVEDVDEVGLTDTTPDDGRLDGSTDSDGDGILLARDDDDAVYGQINLADLLSGSGTDWYSFRSGDWDDPDSWTLDPSGTTRVNPSSLTPNNFVDNVTILNGDEMNLNFNGLVISSITINAGGVVNVGTTINHNFNSISGEGTIKIASDEFPGGVATDFNSSAGGTVSYEDQSPVADYELTTNRTFNNVIINSASNTIVLKADYTLNGDLNVNSGTLQINDNTSDSFTDNTTPLNIQVNGDFTVGASGAVTTGNVDASSEIGTSEVFTFHQLELLGDFINNGSVTFTNLSPTSIADGRYRDKYPTAADADNNTGTNDIPSAEFGVVEVLFTNDSEDQLVTLNGTTDFYRIEVAKGTSQTFKAEFNASSSSNFRLLGRIAMDQSDDSGDTPNIDNHRALGLEAGILKLGDNIVIDQIAKEDNNGSDPSTQGGNRNYIIDLDAQLWLASNSHITKSNDWGIHPFGKLKVSDNATLTFTGTGQRTILVDNQGVFEMTGGTVDITQYRNKTGSDGAPRGSFIMTGGTLNVGQGGADGNHAIFSVPWEDQNFILNAADAANPPEINITLDGNRGKDNAAIQIGVKEGNYNVAASDINIIHTSNTDYKIVSTAPLYNLSYNNSGTGELIISDIIDSNDLGPGAGGVLPDDNSGTTPSPAQFAQPLVLSNDLTITDGRLDANNEDVTVGNLFTIINGGEYDPGANTTYFNGSSPIQQIRLNGTTPLVGGGFNDLVFTGSGTEKRFGGDLATVVVLGDLTIGSGVTLNDNGKIIEVNGDISNSGIHETDYTSPGRIEVTGGSASHEIGGDGNGRFEILTIDDATNSVSFIEDQQIDSILNLENGILDIDIHQLTISSTASTPIRDDLGGVGNFGATRYIRTAGNSSDQGISMFIQSDADDYLFPIGTDQESGTDKYTPAELSISGTSGANSGYVKINVADAVLPTIEVSETDKLTFYWRLNHNGFSSDPSISLRFYYDDEDITGNENQYNGGYVLDEAPFTRVEEDANDDDRNSNELVFNGTSNNGAFPGNRFTIVNANFSAAGSNAWNGAPEIYYSRATNGSWWEWQDTQHWSTDPVNQHLGAAASDYPQAGDIAVVGSVYVDALGCDPCTNSGTGRHQIRIDNTVGNVTVAQLIFDSQAGGSALNVTDMSRVRIRGGFTLAADRISGTGELVQDVGTGPETGTITGDLGDFIEEKNNGFFYWFQSATDVTITDRFQFPIFRSFGGGGTLDFSQDVTAFGIVVDNNTTMSISTNWTIDSLVQIGSNGAGTIEFPNVGSNVTLETGTIVYSNDPGNNISVENAGTDIHRLKVNENIDLTDGTGFDLTTAAGAQVELEVSGAGTHSFINNTGVDADLYRLIVNKGTDQTSSFTFDDNFTLSASSSGVSKAIELQNGTLILNNASIDLDVNEGSGDFIIPATSALNLQAGTVRMTASGSGSGNGLRLNGKISLSGGDLVLDGGSGANNYIEYGAGGGAEIEITSGNLVVGSQLRRSTLSNDGVLNYSQSGGTAVFGVNVAPEDSRGVFEVVNTGVAGTSSFNLSGASTSFAIVNAQSSPDLGTFIIGSDVDVNITTDPIIDFGYNGMVAGVTVQNGLNQTYEINSASPIPNIRIDNANFNAPTLAMVIQPLTISNNLEILNGGTLISNNFNLNVSGGFTNNGTYSPGTNTTLFDGITQQILGSTSTTFNNLQINPTTSLTLSNTITVNGDLDILSGQLDDNGNRITLLGDLNATTNQVSDGSGNGGISMEGVSAQDINLPDGVASFDKLIINNSNGVTIRDNAGSAVEVLINDELALDNGVLKLGDNRLIFDSDAQATTSSSFDENRMISVNGVKKSDGVEKEFVASVDAPTFEIPVGTPGKYTPVTLDVDDSDDPGSILVKPINATHPSATGADVLNYYWVVTTDPTTVANFAGSISFEYLEEDANNAGQNEATWENNATRLIAPNWFKPSGNLVNISTNTITFTNTDLSSFGGTTFDGEYTIGNDIPDELAQYRSNTTGIWNLAGNWDIDIDGDGFDDGNGIPQPGTIVIVRAADEITMDAATDNDQNVFSIQIDGVLDVSDSDGHNFGEVSGTGTLKLSNSTIPGGNYDLFFLTNGGALELSGASNYTISPDFASGIRGLTISGGGTKTLPAVTLNIGSDGININDGAILDNSINNNDATVAGNVNINNGTFLLGNSSASLSAQNFTITTGTYTSAGAPVDLSGDLNINGGTFNAGSGAINLAGDFTLAGAATFNNGNGTIILDGTGNQNLSGDFSTEDFNNLTVNKSTGNVILAASSVVNITNTLTLNGGNINTQASGASLRLLNGVGSVSRTSGFIDGPLQVDLNDDDVFSFPVGKSNTYKPTQIDIQNGSQSANPLTWEVEYYAGTADDFASGENDITSMSSIETNADPDEQVVYINSSDYWRIDSGVGSATLDAITIDISNVGLSSDDINDQLLQVMVWDEAGGEWDHLGGISSGVPSAANVVSTLTQSFSEKIFTSGAESSTALPVELIYFNGIAQDNVVTLSWETATEINNDFFEVQRSLDGISFEVIGIVDGNGNSSESIEYTFKDGNPYLGLNYYRLRQVDFDGADELLPIIQVSNDYQLKGILISSYPNPTQQDNLNVRIQTGDDHTQVSLKIVDMSGRSYVETEFNGALLIDEKLTVTRKMTPGIYFLMVQQGSNIQKHKILIK